MNTFDAKAKRMTSMSKRFYMHHKPSMAPLEVKASNVHGCGVFALEDIKAWQMVTVYPVHYVCRAHPMGGEVRTEYLEKFHEMGDKINEYMTTMEPNDNINTGPTKEISISADPSILDYGVGHMMNDAAKMDALTIPQLKEYMCSYVTKANCTAYHLGDGIIVVMTTKPIKKGEELFTHYGIEYWIKNQRQHIEKISYMIPNESLHYRKYYKTVEMVCKEKVKAILYANVKR